MSETIDKCQWASVGSILEGQCNKVIVRDNGSTLILEVMNGDCRYGVVLRRFRDNEFRGEFTCNYSPNRQVTGKIKAVYYRGHDRDLLHGSWVENEETFMWVVRIPPIIQGAIDTNKDTAA